jgi:hypothetical protein
MSAVKTTYSIESKPTEKDDYELKITKSEESVIITIIHTSYEGSSKITSEGMILTNDDFKKLIDEIWRGN